MHAKEDVKDVTSIALIEMLGSHLTESRQCAGECLNSTIRQIERIRFKHSGCRALVLNRLNDKRKVWRTFCKCGG